MVDKPLVKNAADESQVNSAKKKEKITRRDELDDVAILIKQAAFRRFIWRLFSFCS